MTGGGSLDWWRETEKVLKMSDDVPEEGKKAALDLAKMEALHLADKPRGKMGKAYDNYVFFLYVLTCFYLNC